MEESRDDARGQEAARVRRMWRGIRAQAVVDCAHQVSYCCLIGIWHLSNQYEKGLEQTLFSASFHFAKLYTLGFNLGVATMARRSTAQSAASSSWMSPTSSGTWGGTRRSEMSGQINDIVYQGRNRTHRYTAEIVRFIFVWNGTVLYYIDIVQLIWSVRQLTPASPLMIFMKR